MSEARRTQGFTMRAFLQARGYDLDELPDTYEKTLKLYQSETRKMLKEKKKADQEMEQLQQKLQALDVQIEQVVEIEESLSEKTLL